MDYFFLHNESRTSRAYFISRPLLEPANLLASSTIVHVLSHCRCSLSFLDHVVGLLFYYKNLSPLKWSEKWSEHQSDSSKSSDLETDDRTIPINLWHHCTMIRMKFRRSEHVTEQHQARFRPSECSHLFRRFRNDNRNAGAMIGQGRRGIPTICTEANVEFR